MEHPTYSVIVYSGHAIPAHFQPMIFSQWLRSLRLGNPLFKQMDSKAYYEKYHLFIENLLKKPDCKVRIAVLSDDHDVSLGFSVSREDVLDYIHVHKDQRDKGVATSLVPQGITTFTHITTTALAIWQHKDKYKNLKFNPFA